MQDTLIINFSVALGIGLLMGVEREYKKGDGPDRGPAGVRTFTIVSLAGAVALTLGGAALLAVVTAGVLLLVTASYWRGPNADPGLTTEAALVVAVLLGGFAMREPALAAGLGAIVTALLAARSPLHNCIKRILKEYEIRDAIIFAVATLVILPLLPTRQMGPFGAFNPYTIWVVVILIMAVAATGHIITRIVGTRFGLPFSGFITGFISSTAAIGAMGAQARATPAIQGPAVAGAVLSTAATIVYLAIVLAVTDMAVLMAMSKPLICAGIAAIAYGAAFTLRLGATQDAEAPERSRAFSLPVALGLAATLSGILLITAAAEAWLGTTGITLAAALAGFADAHTSAISVASLAATGKVAPADAVIPILAGITTNTGSKIVFAVAAGGKRFAARVIPGLLLVLAAAWYGALGPWP
jgi:uncharacterized membrane protein (DUF4010 family)